MPAFLNIVLSINFLYAGIPKSHKAPVPTSSTSLSLPSILPPASYEKYV